METRKLIEQIIKEILENKKTLVAMEKSEKVISKYEDFIEGFANMDFYEELTCLDDYSCILLTELSLNDFIDLSMGKSSNGVTKLLVEALLKDKRILLIREGLEYNKYRSSGNRKFISYLEDLEDRLASFGLEFVNLCEVNKLLVDGENDFAHIENIDKKVINRSDIDKLLQRGVKEINIGSKAIITDLAKERIQDNSINVNRLF